MGQADLVTQPYTKNDLNKWSFNHMAIHRDINRRIFELTGTNLPEYVLDPINAEDSGQWQYQHQLMHNNQNAVLGITGQDLLSVDFKDANILKAWLFLHFPEHQQAAALLGL